MIGSTGKSRKDQITLPNNPLRIIDVWEHNFMQEMQNIRQAILTYKFISMDTEFPGICWWPESKQDQYQLVKINVDQLKLIQLGITLADKHGNHPAGVCTWQFNFKFDMKRDTKNMDSMEILVQAGINFEDFKTRGIDPIVFAEEFISSGLVLCEEVTWICFHGGFDFGYILHVLDNRALPQTENDFLELLSIFCKRFIDIKYIMKELDMRGGLSKIGDDLHLDRIGTPHQAGSDSHLTSKVFFELRKIYFQGCLPVMYDNILFGMGKDSAPSSGGYGERQIEEDNAYFTLGTSKSLPEQWGDYRMYPHSSAYYDRLSQNNGRGNLPNGSGFPHGAGGHPNPQMQMEALYDFQQYPTSYYMGDNIYPNSHDFHPSSQASGRGNLPMSNGGGGHYPLFNMGQMKKGGYSANGYTQANGHPHSKYIDTPSN